MPFRYDQVSRARNEIPADPFARFVEVYEAFDESRRFYEDKTPLRFSASALVTTPGDAHTLAAAVREREVQLKEAMGFFSQTAPALRLVMSAVLHKRADDPTTFVRDFEAARKLFRTHKLRRAQIYELLAYTILRGQAGSQAIDEAQVVRVKAIYLALRKHHYWLTGPEDLPACAALAGTESSPAEIGDGTEAVFQALRTRAGWWSGEQLHTASHIMFLSGAAPATITDRAAQLCEQLKAAGYKVRGHDYDNVALLTFLAIPLERIVQTVMETAQRIQKELKMWFGRGASFNLAVSIAFVQLLQGDEELERLSDVKTLLDMQAIIAAQQAAAAAA